MSRRSTLWTDASFASLQAFERCRVSGMVSGLQKAGKWLVSGDIYTPLTNFCFEKSFINFLEHPDFRCQPCKENMVFFI